MPVDFSKWGPKKKQVALRKLCITLIPPGTGSPIHAALKGLTLLGTPGNTLVKETLAWVDNALAAVRAAPAPNPYARMDDEAICDVLLKRLALRHPLEQSASQQLAQALEKHATTNNPRPA